MILFTYFSLFFKTIFFFVFSPVFFVEITTPEIITNKTALNEIHKKNNVKTASDNSLTFAYVFN